ncbi:MAG: linear amide C-N hydrolase [Bradyrhizobiaceae bacterium]|nr:MAG: linear amide C-N hydrolase [Bradyrhizobiaceae bacterium]
MMKRVIAVTVCVLALIALVTQSDACTRILWNNNKLSVFSSRTMDWPESTEPKLVVFPRGVKHDGGLVGLGPEIVVKENPARWTAKYGSIVTTIYGLGGVDGLNEKGLGIHLLYLDRTDFGPRDSKKPGLHAGLWGQYALDNAASVEEALKVLEGVQIVPVEARGHKANVHLALEDASGDSAIIEYIDGKAVIHHGRQYIIMTNEPKYDEQLALLKQQDFSKPSSSMPLPGNVSPVDRFQRATYYSAMLPEPKTDREAVAGVLAIARNVSVPFGAPYYNFGIYNTEYRTAMDLGKRWYFFELSTSPSLIWTDLTQFNLKQGEPVLMLDPDDIALAGDVTAKFHKVKAPF